MTLKKQTMLGWAVVPLALVHSGCMGDSQVASASAPITAQEAQMGAQYHPQFVAEFGGAMTGRHAQYVEQVGRKIAVQSGLANAESAFTVTLLNSPVHNAFAVPGGYVYSTRQLVTLMNNEAELAGVMGHEGGHVAGQPFEILIRLLSPFAPHITEEIWARLGHDFSVHQQTWPAYDPALAVDETVTLVVQVDGKVRDRIPVPAGLEDGQARERALASERVRQHLGGRAPRQVIVVSGRLVNVVT